MKRTAAFLAGLLILLTFSACAQQKEKKEKETFRQLREAYLARGENVAGFEVDPIQDYEGFQFFCVRVCLNTEDAVTIDDLVFFEAHLFYFPNEEDAAEREEQNKRTGVGGTCLRNGKYILLWNSGDQFEDLYRDVFQQQLSDSN